MKTAHNSGEEFVEIVFTQCVADSYELLSDSSGGILRVRQKATRANSRNKNKRVYPKHVLQDAIRDARPRARTGVMISEYRHPRVAVVDGEEHYIDNYDRKTASVDEISDVQPDGWVYITRTIKDTREGRRLAERYRSGNPPGISTRFKMRGHRAKVDGVDCLVADSMDIITWDDVDNPAFDDTREYNLLSDQTEAQDWLLLSDGAIDALSFSRSGAPQSASGRSNPTMNEQIRRALNSLNLLIAKGASKEDYLKQRKAVVDEMEKAAEENEDLSEPTQALAKADASYGNMSVPGYNSGGPKLTATFGAETGTPGDPGWGDWKEGAETKPDGWEGEMKSKESGTLKNDASLTPEEVKALRAQAARAKQSEADAARESAIKAAADEASDSLRKFTPSQRDYLLNQVREKAQSPEDVKKLLSDEIERISAVLAPERLSAAGLASGQTTRDYGSPAYTNPRPPAWMEGVDKILTAADDYRARTMGEDASQYAKRRALNRQWIEGKLIPDMIAREDKYKSIEEKFAAEDSLYTGGEKAFADAIQVTGGTPQMLNQPTLSMALLIQSFQDLESLQWVDPMGPGLNGGAAMGGFELTGNNGVDGRVGSILKIPVEYYNAPSNYGVFAGNQYDAGLLTPEATGIDEGEIRTVWLPFAPTWRRIAISATRDAIKAMGNGPLNYPLVARMLFHIAYDKQRRIDKALLDEMMQISDEYGAIAVANETVSLANNSAGLTGNVNGTSVLTVNLNPSKVASALVASTDPAVTYGSNVVAAFRLKTAGNGTSAPYCGTVNGVNPLVRARTRFDITAAGALTTTTDNPITISAPASQVEGYLDSTGAIQSKPGTTATYAIDWNNGVVVVSSAFNSNNVVSSGGVVTTPGTVTFSAYSYVTNFDNFTVNNLTSLLAVGETPQMYLSRLLAQFDTTAAKMGSQPRYVKPNLALMSLNASAWITQASIFYKLNSPDGTDLFPTENYFFERTGIKGARLNSPWFAGDTRILLTRRGSTKYAVDTPFEIRGPYPAYDSSGRIIPKEIYYGEELSVIATPQVKDQNGNILNPVARSIILR